MSLTLDQWEARLRTAAVTFTLQYGVPVVTGTAKDVKIEARFQVPIDTQRLHDSITEQQPSVETNRVTQEVTAGGVVIRERLVDYAKYVHDGTSSMGPRPYLDTAARIMTPRFERAAARAAVKSLT